MSENRTTTFQRNQLLEQLLASLNADLSVSEELLIGKNHNTPLPYPLILVMGPLRSGTTLITQWLANTGLVAYPTNLLSRFYQAPIIGAKIQLLLTDPRYNFRDELGEFTQVADFKSENGKTKGVLAPNEFWYFWRRFLPERDRDVWSDDELTHGMQTSTMLAELAGMMGVFDKPFAAKGMLFNYNIPFLDAIFDKVLFIQIKRDPVANIASVLKARQRQLGSESEWYSFKIPEYDQLKGLPPVSQATGQIHYINQAISRGLENVASHRKITVHYEEFCRNPESLYQELTDKLGLASPRAYCGPSSFDYRSDGDIQNRNEILTALDSFRNS